MEGKDKKEQAWLDTSYDKPIVSLDRTFIYKTYDWAWRWLGRMYEGMSLGKESLMVSLSMYKGRLSNKS